jgi:hypothetical protein
MSEQHDIPLHKWERIQSELEATRHQSQEMAREAVLLRKALEEAKHELVLFKSNNRYQKGYGDGYAFAVDDMRKKLTELPPRG